MNPLERLKKLIFIEEDDEIIEETQAELEPVKIEDKRRFRDMQKIEISPEDDEGAEQTREVEIPRNKKLSDIVLSADELESKPSSRTTHLKADSSIKAVKSDMVIEKKTYEYKSSPIISPIFGVSEKTDSKVIVATKPQEEEVQNTAAAAKNKSRLDTIISPIYGADMNYRNTKLVNTEETVDYYEQNIVVDENTAEDTREMKAEELSLDDILETPVKKVFSKTELNRNMTIFDEELKEEQ